MPRIILLPQYRFPRFPRHGERAPGMILTNGPLILLTYALTVENPSPPPSFPLLPSTVYTLSLSLYPGSMIHIWRWGMTVTTWEGTASMSRSSLYPPPPPGGMQQPMAAPLSLCLSLSMSSSRNATVVCGYGHHVNEIRRWQLWDPSCYSRLSLSVLRNRFSQQCCRLP